MKRFVLTLGLSVVICAPLAAREIIFATALPRVTLTELPARPDDETRPREIRHPRRFSGLPFGSFKSGLDFVPARLATLAAPPITAGFGSVTSFHLAPGDSTGAVSPRYVTGVTNGGINIHDRDGKSLYFAGLRTLWNAGFNDRDDYYDPRIAYDSTADRWIVISLYGGRDLLIGVTETGDPTGVWRRFKLSLSGIPVGGIDFTHLALTRDTAVIVTYDDAYNSLVLSVAKADLYAATSPLPIRSGVSPKPGIAPVTAEESTSEYLVALDLGLERRLIFTTADNLGQWQSVPLAFRWYGGTFFLPQLGTSNYLDAGFMSIENAVYRNGTIGVVQTVALDHPLRTSVLWTKFNPVTAQRMDSGIVEDPTGKKEYSYPSLAMNRSGAMLIGFSTFSSTAYVSAGFVYVDPAGRISQEGLVKAGEGPVTNTDRWGDYTATVVDPLDDNAFWTAQLFAKEDRWVTWWAKVETTPIPSRRRAARH